MVRRPEAILIDLDGTLLDTDAGGRAAVDATGRLADELLGVPSARWKGANAAAFAAVWRRDRDGWVLGSVTSAELSDSIYSTTLEAVGADPALARRFSETHATVLARSARLFADAPPFLAAASAARIPLALVTNGGVSQRSLITTLGLDDRFAHVYVSAEHGIAKPDPFAFLSVCAALGADPARCWHIGDGLSTDVAGALDAGLAAIWMNRAGVRPPDPTTPGQSIRSLDELIRPLEAGTTE